MAALANTAEAALRRESWRECISAATRALHLADVDHVENAEAISDKCYARRATAYLELGQPVPALYGLLLIFVSYFLYIISFSLYFSYRLPFSEIR